MYKSKNYDNIKPIKRAIFINMAETIVQLQQMLSYLTFNEEVQDCLPKDAKKDMIVIMNNLQNLMITYNQFKLLEKEDYEKKKH